jgi:hypothetical protein
MKPLTRLGISIAFCLGILGWGGSHSALLAQTPQVTSATPPAAAQGTINLNVVIGGSGFKKGAQAQWFISGTTNPGGVIVNSTAFNSSSQLTANITVSDTADIASFDVVVYSGGRTGKGTGLFNVTQKGTPTGCVTMGTPSGFTLVKTLNYVNASGAPQYGPGFGNGLRVRPVVLTAGSQSKTVLIAAVGAPATTGKLEIFFLDPATGQVLDGTVIVGTQVQPHITVAVTTAVRSLEAGDIDANGIPDFVQGNGGSVNVTMGYEDSTTGIVRYGPAIVVPPPANSPGGWGWGATLGNLDGNLGDNVIIGASGGGSGKKAPSGMVFIYDFNGSTSNPGFNLVGSLNDPLANPNANFGYAVDVGPVTGSGANSLIVGAPGATINGVSTGGVFVFPAPLSSPTTYYTMGATTQGEGLGSKVGSGTLTSSTATDVVAATNWSSSTINMSVFSGPIAGNRAAPSFVMPPYPGMTAGWATHIDVGEMNGDGWTDVLVGAPNVTNSPSCNYGAGSAQLYLSNPSSTSGPQWTLYPFQAPVLQSDSLTYGYGVALVPDVPEAIGFTPLIMVGAGGADLGGVTSAGQVYVYKKN